MLPFNNKQILSALVKAGVLSEKEVEKIKKDIKEENKDLDDYLVEKNIATEKIIYSAIADYLKVPFIDLKNQTIEPEILFTISEPLRLAISLWLLTKRAKKYV